MKFINIVTAFWITAFVPATTSTSIHGTEEENGILKTSDRLTIADVLDQKTQISNGNEVSNASSFNPQGQPKSTSS
jgi:hypothetical protein